jgi:hypothetical protein
MAQRTVEARPQTEDRVALAREFGYTVRIKRNIGIDLLKPAIQTRVRGVFPEDILQEYMENMRGGAKFPMPLITEDNGVVCGKTTTEAYRRLGVKNVDCLVLEGVHYIGAGAPLLAELTMMDAYSNQTNGVRLGQEDIKALIAVATRQGIKPEKLAAKLGIHTRLVNAEVNYLRGLDRLSLLKVDLGKLQVPQIKALGKNSGRLNDAPFTALAELTRDAGLRSQEVDAFTRQVGEARSDAAAVAMFKRQRAGELLPRIRHNEITGQSGPRVRTDWEIMNLHVSGVLKFKGKEREILHREPVGDPAFAEMVETKLINAIDILTEMLKDLK